MAADREPAQRSDANSGPADAQSTGRALDLTTEERRRSILALVRAREFVRVTEISALFGVSEVTVRTDLEVLADRGQLRRVRGGAMSRLLPPPERSFAEGLTTHSAEKALIARVAAEHVHSGETILLDVGTTTTAVAEALLARHTLQNVVVMTNSLNIALDLEAAIPRFTVVVLGGTLRPMAHSLVDPLGEMTLERIHAHTVFLGCNGVDGEHGITNTNLAEVNTKRRLLRAARRRIVVADGSKLGVVALAHICDIQDIDLIITDTSANPQIVGALREHNVDVVLAG